VDLDLLDLYTRASAWTLTKVRGAAGRLDAPTTCERWSVRSLMNHMLLVQGAFVAHARGEAFTLSLEEDPPDVLSDDPSSDFEQARAETLRVFAEPGVIEATGTNLGNIFGDQLIHGWDLAVSTGQDAIMPAGLPEAAFDLLHGAFTEEGRKGVLAPEVAVAADASAQDRLLAYAGRDPSWRM
jgi:uncharacterized protein (TIGR03086 family)